MNASQMHGVIAAGLADPDLLARWRQDPTLLRGFGLNPADLDLDALWKFAGLTTKVRSNGLRNDLPMTLRLLNVTGLEIEVFAHFAHYAAKLGKQAGASDAKARLLVEFLGQWLDRKCRAHALLWDLVRHESALATLVKLEPLPEVPVRCAQPATLHTIPRVRGQLALHAMTFDPRMACESLRAKTPRLDDIPVSSFHLGYWRNPIDGAVRILEFEEGVFYLLDLIDGTRSLAALGRLVGSSGDSQLLRVLRPLTAVGLLDFGVSPDAGS